MSIYKIAKPEFITPDGENLKVDVHAERGRGALSAKLVAKGATTREPLGELHMPSAWFDIWYEQHYIDIEEATGGSLRPTAIDRDSEGSRVEYRVACSGEGEVHNRHLWYFDTSQSHAVESAENRNSYADENPDSWLNTIGCLPYTIEQRTVTIAPWE